MFRFATVATLACVLQGLLAPPAFAQTPTERGHPVAAGAFAGAGVAAIATFVGAARYGRNESAEGGRFCGACFVQWSTLTVPVGAAMGAAIGFGIDRARRQSAARWKDPKRIHVAPVIAKRGGGVFVSARF